MTWCSQCGEKDPEDAYICQRCAADQPDCEGSPDLFKSAIEWSERHGPANSWSGTNGTGALIIRDLLSLIRQRGDDVLEAVYANYEEGSL